MLLHKHTSNDGNQTAATPSDVSAEEQAKYRLPGEFIPEEYFVSYDVALNDCEQSFTGTVAIDGQVTRPTSTIVLNAKDLDISNVFLWDKAKRIEGTVSLDEELQRAELSFPVTLQPGKASFELSFSAKLRDDMEGFYRSSYKDNDGKLHWLASTQFEPAAARAALPCFDEPALKAKFWVEVTCDAKYTVLSNGKAFEEAIDQATGKKTVCFDPTIDLSTYLLAVVVSELESTEAVNVDGVELRAWTTPGKIDQAAFALEAGVEGLSRLVAEFDMPFPGNKIDMVAIPDFRSGAMENHGLITYRESCLLVDSVHGSQKEKEEVAETVIHELVHQWFGNTVTMKWWDDLWLNEAFATNLSLTIINDWKPEWRIWDGSMFGAAVAKSMDSKKSTRKIACPIHKPEDLDQMFDALTYQKGCAVLRMLCNWIGREAYREGVRLYLKTYKFGNATANDLYRCFQTATKLPVREFMQSWLEQAGFPMVSVEQHGPGCVKLTQQQFKTLAHYVDPTMSFLVPVAIRATTTEGQVIRRSVLLKGLEPMEVCLTDELQCVVVDAGFSRVRYSDELMVALGKNIQANMQPSERYNLVNDTLACTLAGQTSPTELLQLLQQFGDERDPNVWESVEIALRVLYRFIPESLRQTFSKTVNTLVKPAATQLSWETASEDSTDTRLLRGKLLKLLATLGDDSEAHDLARDKYVEYTADRRVVDPNTTDAIFAAVAHAGCIAEFMYFLERATTSNDAQEVERYLFALTQFRQPQLVEKLLDVIHRSLNPDTAKGKETIRNQDTPRLLIRLSGNRDFTKRIWSFVNGYWQDMRKVYSDSHLTELCGSVAGIATDNAEKEMEELFAIEELKKGRELKLDQHREQFEINKRFRAFVEADSEQLAKSLGE
jgi:puromycin-sensitive aminopeptidase